MSVTMQHRILERLEKVATSYGLEPIQQLSFANDGHLYAQTDDLTTVWDCYFSFQATYVTLEFTGPAISAADLTDASPYPYRWQRETLSYHHLDYTAGERIREMLTLLTRITRDGSRAARKPATA